MKGREEAPELELGDMFVFTLPPEFGNAGPCIFLGVSRQADENIDEEWDIWMHVGLRKGFVIYPTDEWRVLQRFNQCEDVQAQDVELDDIQDARL